MFSNLSTTAFLVWGAVFLAIAVAGGIGACLFNGRSRVMSAMPTSKIGSASPGYVEFAGRAKTMAGTEVKGPLTDSPCLWYEYEITRQMGGHGSSSTSQWVNVDKARSDDEFLLVDDTGMCVINPQGARVITAPALTDRWVGHTDRPTSGPEKRGSRAGLFPGQSYSSYDFGNGLWFSTRKDYRYMERRIQEGSPLYVIGRLQTTGNGQDNRDASVSALLRSWKDDQQQLLARFDADGDGRIDMAEWEAARQAAEQEADRQSGATEKTATVRVLGATGNCNRPFIISALSQEQLLSRYRLLVRACLAASLFGGILLIALITGRF